jgi:hypothetical protein
MKNKKHHIFPKGIEGAGILQKGRPLLMACPCSYLWILATPVSHFRIKLLGIIWLRMGVEVDANSKKPKVGFKDVLAMAE